MAGNDPKIDGPKEPVGPPPPIITPIAPDVDFNRTVGDASPYIAEAARGDLAAQRHIRESWLALLATGKVVLSPILAIETICYARLCAGHGLPEDAWRLQGALRAGAACIRGGGLDFLADHWTAEAVSILEDLTALGDETAAVAANALVANDPRATAVAQVLSDKGAS